MLVQDIRLEIVLTAIAIGAAACIVKIPIEYDTNTMGQHKEFIVNKRTLKIHIPTCPSVDKMSEKNKLKKTNSLNQLINEGYYICNRCKAGIKRKNELVASFLEYTEGLLFGETDITYKSNAEYLSSIDEMGKWYVSHVATYEQDLDEAATEEAKKYFNNSNITKKGNIYCYPCDRLRNCEGGYRKAGDDCVRFIFSCLNSMDNSFVHTLSRISKYKWSSINSRLLNAENNRLQYAMSNLGFEIYDVKAEKIDINGDGYFEYEIFALNNDFTLQSGDILSRDGHVHMYLNDNENFGWGKVNNVYPQKSRTYIDRTTHNIICNGETFNRVYRYVGEN